LGAYIYGRGFRQLIIVFQTKRAPAVKVVQNQFVFSLFCVGQLIHVDGMLSAVETVQKLLLHLPPTVDGLKLQVGIPVKGDTFQHLDDLLHHQIIVHASTVVCLDKMCNMLFWIALSIELQEF